MAKLQSTRIAGTRVHTVRFSDRASVWLYRGSPTTATEFAVPTHTDVWVVAVERTDGVWSVDGVRCALWIVDSSGGLFDKIGVGSKYGYYEEAVAHFDATPWQEPASGHHKWVRGYHCDDCHARKTEASVALSCPATTYALLAEHGTPLAWRASQGDKRTKGGVLFVCELGGTAAFLEINSARFAIEPVILRRGDRVHAKWTLDGWLIDSLKHGEPVRGIDAGLAEAERALTIAESRGLYDNHDGARNQFEEPSPTVKATVSPTPHTVGSILVCPPREVCDGFGYKRGKAWDAFCRELAAATERNKSRIHLLGTDGTPVVLPEVLAACVRRAVEACS